MLAYGAICGDVTYAYGVFLPSMSETFGWSRSALSGPYTLFLIIGGMLGPLVGFTIARFGARKNIIVGNILAVLGLAGHVSGPGNLARLPFFRCDGRAGPGLFRIFNHDDGDQSLVHRKRSLALGFLFASGGVGGFFLPPLISSLMSGFGLALDMGLPGWYPSAAGRLFWPVFSFGTHRKKKASFRTGTDRRSSSSSRTILPKVMFITHERTGAFVMPCERRRFGFC